MFGEADWTCVVQRQNRTSYKRLLVSLTNGERRGHTLVHYTLVEIPAGLLQKIRNAGSPTSRKYVAENDCSSRIIRSRLGDSRGKNVREDWRPSRGKKSFTKAA